MKLLFDQNLSPRLVESLSDADFSELGLLSGFPPKSVWIRRGNCSTSDIEEILSNNVAAIESLILDSETGILVLF